MKALLYEKPAKGITARSFKELEEAKAKRDKKGGDDVKKVDVIFKEELKRVKQNIEGGFITPRLASALLEHFGRALSRVDEGFDYLAACEDINPDHKTTMLAYRTSKPSDLLLDQTALDNARKLCVHKSKCE